MRRLTPMTTRMLLMVLLVAGLAGGCKVNAVPEVVSAEAGCFFDASLQRDFWYFDAEVFDRDGPSDVVLVEANVYDDSVGVLVDHFDLLPTSDPWIWYTEHREINTNLDCDYPLYSVDFIVWDALDASDLVTVIPITY